MANPFKYSYNDYMNALSKYDRAIESHNRRIDEYNKTLAFDSEGRTIVKDKFNNDIFAVDVDGKLVQTNLPEGKNLEDFNYSALPDSNRFWLVRQGKPLEQFERRTLDPNKNPYSSSDPYVEYVESVYQAKPDEFTGTAPNMPTLTVSQAKRLANEADPLAAERGIISDVIASRGVK